MLCYVTRYDPATRRPVGEPQLIEADTKHPAAEQACRCPLVPAGPGNAIISVIGLEDMPNQRQYFRKP
jgi:hypothetical protein